MTTNKVALNVKNMKERYINYSGTRADMESIWNTYREMAILGFISREEWKRFFDACKGWYIDEDTAEVRDNEDNDKLVYAYNPDYLYHA